MTQDPAEHGTRAVDQTDDAGERTAAFPAPQQHARPALDDTARREALERSGAGEGGPRTGYGPGPDGGPPPVAATTATTGAGSAQGTPPRGRPGGPEHAQDRTAVQERPAGPTARPERPGRGDLRGGAARPGSARPVGRRRARLVLQRVDPWSVFLFSLVASICLGIVLLVAVATLYVVLANLGVLSSVNNLLGEVLGSAGPDAVVEPFFTPGRVLGATAVLAAVDVVLLTVLATLSALLYNLCATLTGGVEVQLGEREQ